MIVVGERVRTATCRARLILAGAALLAAVFLAGAIAAPQLEAGGTSGGAWLRLAYRPACHQQPDRCVDLGHGPLAVCARCLGLYLGGLIALTGAAAVVRTFRPPLAWLLVTAAVNLVDFAVGLAGLPNFGNWPRLAIALPLGFVCGLYLGDALADLSSDARAAVAGGRDRGSDPVQ